MNLLDKILNKTYAIFQVFVSDILNFSISLKDNYLLKPKNDFQQRYTITTNKKAVKTNYPVWSSNQIILNNMIQSGNLRKFLQWPLIQHSMFFNDRKICNIEYEALRKSSIWNTVWKNNIFDPYFGYPLRYPKMFTTSCNSIHHAYHLEKFFQSVNYSKLNEIDLIIEFGGGYGNLCRILYNIGYRNEYWLFDLPEFVNMQEYYLSNTNNENVNKISFISHPEELVERYENLQSRNILFIATWSLSESPLSVREKIISIISNSNYFLIAYQNNFCNIDNEKYFLSITNNITQKTIWKKEIITHLPDSSYLIGISF